MVGATRRIDLIEAAAAIVLSLAGLATTWSGFQAALWDGRQAEHYARAGAIRSEATKRALDADMREEVELQLFIEWMDATAAGDARLAQFYRDRFPPEFRQAFDVWMARKPLANPAAPTTPFTERTYVSAERAEAIRIQRAADAEFTKGKHATEVSDSFIRATVLFALALFFAGIAQVFDVAVLRAGLVGLAALALALGVVQAITLPAIGIF